MSRTPSTSPDHQVNAFGFSGLVIIEEQLRLFGQERGAEKLPKGALLMHPHS
jgi:hypothetical protein